MLKPRFSPGELRRRMVAELWFYPDSSRTLELSTKRLPAGAFRPPPQGLPTSWGFGLAGEQATKTKTAHRVFSHSLHAGATA
jgi:hypothetical protein